MWCKLVTLLLVAVGLSAVDAQRGELLTFGFRNGCDDFTAQLTKIVSTQHKHLLKRQI